jgi:hypothetical protein
MSGFDLFAPNAAMREYFGKAGSSGDLSLVLQLRKAPERQFH